MEKRRLNFNHPKDVGLNYWSHLKFTWGESLRSLGMFFVMIIHGIFPPIFDNKFSEYIKKAQKRINKISITTPKAWGDSSTTIRFEE
jgi:hypothetical protein